MNGMLSCYNFLTLRFHRAQGTIGRSGDYPGYNAFHDAINERKRILRKVDWARYNERKRYNKRLKPEDFTTEHILQYKRLPG